MHRLGSTRSRVEDRRAARGRRAPRAAVAIWRIEGDPDVAWIKIDDKAAHDPKFRAIEPALRFAAMGVWWAGIGFSQHYETDGHIRPGDLGMLAPPDARPEPQILAELVRVGLLDRVDDGWCIHNFTKYNLSAAERARLRSENAERKSRRQRRWRRGKKQKDSPIPEGDADTPVYATPRRRVYKTSTSHVDAALRPHQTETETETEREKPPPTPPVATAPEMATGPDRSSLSPVLNPNRPGAPLQDWQLGLLRLRDNILRERAAEADQGDAPPGADP